MRIQLASGKRTEATYVRHLRTLTGPCSGCANRDLDLYRLKNGREIVCECPDDARATPQERRGLTPDQALFIE